MEQLVFGMMASFYLKTQEKYVTLNDSRCVQSLDISVDSRFDNFFRRSWVRAYAQPYPHSLADKATSLVFLECDTKRFSF